MKRKVPVGIAIAIALLAMTVTFSLTMVISMASFDRTVSSVVEKQALYSKLGEMDKYVRSSYYGDIDDTILNDRLAQGYLSGIQDEYATYYSEKEYSELKEYENGTRVGIGLKVIKDVDGYFSIVRVFDESPAEKAGIRQGGKIIQVDDVESKTVTSERAMQSLLGGEQGTNVEIKCLYGNDEESFSIQRINFTAPTVEYTKVGDYGYVRIYDFGPNSYTDFDFIMSEAVSDGVLGIVFDLRGTAGDNYRSAYDIIDYVCPLGVIAKSRNKSGVVKTQATSDDEAVDLPMAVLVDATTAGYAELFAVSVKELNEGVIVGAKTKGKWMIQSAPQRLSDGSAVVITTDELLTGSDESFNGKGVPPDVEIASALDDPYALYNPQPNSDPHIIRAFEVVRNIIIGKGEEAPELKLEKGADAAEMTEEA